LGEEPGLGDLVEVNTATTANQRVVGGVGWHRASSGGQPKTHGGASQSRPDKSPMTANTPPAASANPIAAKMALAKTAMNESSYNMARYTHRYGRRIIY
jgi:hypothetical protein